MMNLGEWPTFEFPHVGLILQNLSHMSQDSSDKKSNMVRHIIENTWCLIKKNHHGVKALEIICLAGVKGATER